MIYIQINQYTNRIKMKLQLNNFKCWEDASFDLGKEGHTLISSASGTGKSSIFSAIIFALSGDGKKVVMYGKIKCKVVFEYKDYIITRTKSPNKLLLRCNNEPEKEWKNQEAQDIINDRFGVLFTTLGIVKQKAENSFISMTPSTKLEFLEKFAFEGVDLKKIKENIKHEISKRKEQLQDTITRLSTTENILKNSERPDLIKKPIGYTTDIVKETKANIICLEENVSDLEETVEEAKEAIITMNKLQLKVQHKNAMIEMFKTEQMTINVISKEQAESKKSQLDDIINYEKFLEMKKRLETEEENHKNYVNEKIKEIESELWQQGSKKDIEKKLEDLQKLKDNKDQLKQLKDEYDSDHHITLLEQMMNETMRYVNCPSCLSKFILYEDGTTKANNVCLEENKDNHSNRLSLTELSEIKKKIQTYDILQQQIKNLTDIISEYKHVLQIDDVKKEIYNVKKLLSHYYFLEKKLVELKSGKEPQSIIKLRLEIIKMNVKKIDTSTKDELIITLHTNKTNKKRYESISENIQKEQKNLDDTIRKLDTLKNCNVIDYTSTLDEKRRELSNLKTRLTKYVEYSHYTNQKTEINRLETDIKSLTKQKIIDNDNLSSILVFKDKVSEAQSITIENVIDRINTLTANYIYPFFDGDMSVSLTSWTRIKTTKNIKPQIDLVIVNRGDLTDFSSLSGGEQDRISLAFSLSLADMFHLPFIMLDEATSSLDNELTEKVLTTIRENYNNQTLFIAHQLTTGHFNKILNITRNKQ